MVSEPFGPYSLIRRLAVGGMGELYLAKRKGALGFSKLVVVKRIRKNLAADRNFVEMFLNEGRLISLLDHPNLVQIYELGQYDGIYFMAMEYVPGRDLSALLGRKRGPLPLPMALQVMISVCEGLSFAHEAQGADGEPLGVVHRDINPQNVLISYSGTVKLTDFGVAKARVIARDTQVGVLKGNLGYLSPEQARSENVDMRSDVYSLGLLLFETTLGQPAIPGMMHGELLSAAADGRTRRPEDVDSRYPKELGTIFARATAREPKDRYQTVKALQQDVLRFQVEQRIAVSPAQLSDEMKALFAEEWRDEQAQRRAALAVTATEGQLTDGQLPQADIGSEILPAAELHREVAPERGTVVPAKIQFQPPIPVSSSVALHAPRAKRVVMVLSTLVGLGALCAIVFALTARDEVPAGRAHLAAAARVDGGPGVHADDADGAPPSREAPISGEERDNDHQSGAAHETVAARDDEPHPSTPSGGPSRPVDRPPVAGPSRQPSRAKREEPHGARPTGAGSASRTAVDAKTSVGTTPPHARPEPSPKPPPLRGPSAAAAVIQPPAPVAKAESASANLPDMTLRLTVTSRPKMVVFYKGQRLGVTPLGVDLPLGAHPVEFRNHKLGITLTRTIQVVDQGPLTYDVTVGQGLLMVKARPWSTVEIDGTNRGTTPLKPLRLYEGRHHVKLTYPVTGESYQSTVTITADEDSQLVHVFKDAPPH